MEIGNPNKMQTPPTETPPLPPSLTNEGLKTQTTASKQLSQQTATPSQKQGKVSTSRFVNNHYAKQLHPSMKFLAGLILLVKKGADVVFKTTSTKIKELGKISKNVLTTISNKSQTLGARAFTALKPVNLPKLAHNVSKLSEEILTRLQGLSTKLTAIIKESYLSRPAIPKARGDEEIGKPCLQGRHKYQTCEKEFVDLEGKTKGSEVIERTKSVQMRKTNLEAKIAKLKEASDPKLGKELESCEKELKVCNDHLDKLDWIDSNHSRDVLDRPFLEAREKIIPVAVNLRKQTVDIQGTKQSFLRFGAVWDPRNGLGNMRELNELHEQLSKLGTKGHQSATKAKELNGKIDEKIARLESIKAPSVDQQAAIKDAVATLNQFKATVGEDNTVTVNLEAASDSLRNRRQFLRSQLLEPTLMQLRDKYDGSGTLKMMHLGLLNSKAHLDLQSSGWAHHESNQIKDMHAAFMDLNDCKVVFLKHSNTGGSYFEEDSKGKPILYVNPKDLDKEGEPFAQIEKDVKIETCYMNISPQDKFLTTPKNEGLQREINEEQIKTLYSWVKDTLLEDTISPKLDAIKARLDAGESSFELAADLLLIAKDFTAISEGCLSCKDRGGTVAEMLAIRMINEKAPNGIEKRSRDKWYNEMFSKKSPLVQVVNDCTGATVAKVNHRLIADMGKWTRVRALINLVGARFSGGLTV